MTAPSPSGAGDTPKPDRAVLVDILSRVQSRRPLCHADRDGVLFLIKRGFMHVTSALDRVDPCPYRLTERGVHTLATAQRLAQRDARADGKQV